MNVDWSAEVGKRLEGVPADVWSLAFEKGGRELVASVRKQEVGRVERIVVGEEPCWIFTPELPGNEHRFGNDTVSGGPDVAADYLANRIKSAL